MLLPCTIVLNGLSLLYASIQGYKVYVRVGADIKSNGYDDEWSGIRVNTDGHVLTTPLSEFGILSVPSFHVLPR